MKTFTTKVLTAGRHTVAVRDASSESNILAVFIEAQLTAAVAWAKDYCPRSLRMAGPPISSRSRSLRCRVCVPTIFVGCSLVCLSLFLVRAEAIRVMHFVQVQIAGSALGCATSRDGSFFR